MKINKFSSKGFTLIELLIVIAILGIMAAAVLVAINPAKRINQAKDSNIKSDMGQIANAVQAYYTSKGASGTPYYPRAVADLVVEGEMKAAPKTPAGTDYSVSGATAGGAACTTVGADCADIIIYTLLNEYPTSYYCWASATGTIKVSAPGATAPTATATACP